MMNRYTRSEIEKKMLPHTKRKAARKVLSTVLKLIFAALLILLIAGGFYLYSQVKVVVDGAPDISNVSLTPSEAATYIYNRDGQRVQKLTLPEANRDLVKLSDVPDDLIYAAVAIEDARFFEHHGIDPKGIVRALMKGMTTGSFSEGASTITQQLLKNSVFPGWTTESTFRERIIRKIQEQYLALKLEKEMTKEEILENYLNMINLGAGCYGVQAAAYRYFGKNVSDLTLSEAAVIAGITQNPTAYNPLVFPEKNEKRRKMVLDAMLDQGYIDIVRYNEAMADDVYARIRDHSAAVDTTSTIYTFYQDALIDQVMEDLQEELAYTYQQAYRAVYSGGLRIYSAQDDEIQKIADEEFDNPENFPSGLQVGIDYALSVEGSDRTITDYGNSDLRAFVRSTSDPAFDLMYTSEQEARAGAEAFRASVVKEGDTVLGERVTITPQPQASCVIIDQSTGLVAALVGGRGEKEASLTLNRASYTTRQPGSTFKILTAYGPAIDQKKLTLASTIVDEPYNYSTGTPVNNAGQNYQGEVTVRQAIAQSINVAAVRVLNEIVTPQTGYEYAGKFGITTLTDHYETANGVLTDVGETLALGGITRGVTNLELTGAYAAIANLGHLTEPKFYTQVLDQYGNVVLDNSEPKTRTVISEAAAQLLTSAMEDVIRDETGTAYGMIDLGGMPTAGKTGTTSDWRDSWFVGFTPYYTCGIWAGYDNNDRLPDTDLYHTYSKILWNAIMKRVNAGKAAKPFDRTGDVTQVKICSQTHMASAFLCPQNYEELFEQGTQPLYFCNVHGNGAPVSGQPDGLRGTATGNITIYNTDQTTLVTTPQPQDEIVLQPQPSEVIPEPEMMPQPEDTGGVIPAPTDGNIPDAAGGNVQDVSDGTIPEASGGAIPEASGGMMPADSGWNRPGGAEQTLPDIVIYN